MQNIIYATISQMLGRGGYMLASMLLAKNLILEDFSSYSYLLITATMIGVYSSLGLGVISSRSYAKLSTDEETSLEEISALWLMNILISIAIWIVLSLGVGQILLSDDKIANGLFIALVLSITLGIIPGGAMQGLAAFKTEALIAAPKFIIIMIGAIWASKTSSLLPAVLGLLLSQCFKTLFEAIYVIKASAIKKQQLNLQKLLNGIKRILEPVSSTALVSILAGSATWIMATLLKYSAGDYEFALFSIGIQWFALVLFLPGIFTRVVFAQQVKLASTKSERHDKHHHLYFNLIRNFFTASIFCLVFIVLAPWIISLYGSKFIGMHHSLIGYLLAGVAAAALNLIGNALIAQNLTKSWLILTIVWLLLLIFSGWLLITPFGSLGAGIAYALSYSVLFVLAFLTLKKHS